LLLPFHHNFNTAIQEIVILENTMLTKTKPMTSQHQKVTQDIIVFSTITITSHCMKELGTLALIIPSHHNINPITLHSHDHQLISDRFCVFSLYTPHQPGMTIFRNSVFSSGKNYVLGDGLKINLLLKSSFNPTLIVLDCSKCAHIPNLFHPYPRCMYLTSLCDFPFLIFMIVYFQR